MKFLFQNLKVKQRLCPCLTLYSCNPSTVHTRGAEYLHPSQSLENR